VASTQETDLLGSPPGKAHGVGRGLDEAELGVLDGDLEEGAGARGVVVEAGALRDRIQMRAEHDDVGGGADVGLADDVVGPVEGEGRVEREREDGRLRVGRGEVLEVLADRPAHGERRHGDQDIVGLPVGHSHTRGVKSGVCDRVELQEGDGTELLVQAV